MLGCRRRLNLAGNVPNLAVAAKATSNILGSCVTFKPSLSPEIICSSRTGRERLLPTPEISIVQTSDDGFAIAVDAKGDMYVTGENDSLNYPLVNPLQPDLNEDCAFIAKLKLSTDSLPKPPAITSVAVVGKSWSSRVKDSATARSS
jgi:hypothetical protein